MAALRDELKFKEDIITRLVPAGHRARVRCMNTSRQAFRCWALDDVKGLPAAMGVEAPQGQEALGRVFGMCRSLGQLAGRLSQVHGSQG